MEMLELFTADGLLMLRLFQLFLSESRVRAFNMGSALIPESLSVGVHV
ncbi:Uncharacterised protein [Yersinia pekkanenii]|uniref:Uncharacterized protein n=1 Tax=Yersinia pekkanenii TaxID=1288385 RepID=A0A0T9NIG0_9GAMM|nr:Uncharacterised protein [Yersinia pekkanenii]CRY65393.1 Uncharacterised protein [Yersinia pekkanenii]